MQVIPLQPLTGDVIEALLDRALADAEKGLGSLKLQISPEARRFLARLAIGDARRALNALEWVATVAREQGKKELSLEFVSSTAPGQPPPFDQEGDYHYDTISAFIKSMRGSDPDAALYYMIRALDAGEDPLFITRRMIIFASEDASCDPRTLEIALNVDRAVERLGMPEARIPMAHGAVYLSCCAKSNASYCALREMEEIVRKYPDAEIPRRLRNAPTELMRQMGNSIGYRSPHDTAEGFLPERYLPAAVGEVRVYHPTDRALDAQIRVRLAYYESLIKRGNARS
jgi:putative ATPase